MPIREPEMVWDTFTHNGREITYKMHKSEWEDIQNIKKIFKDHNSDTEKLCKDIQKKLLEETGSEYEVTTRAFKKIVEGIGLEMIKPRNYLTNEVIEIKSAGKGEPHHFYWGEFANFEEAVKLSVERIKTNYVRPAERKPEPIRKNTEPTESGNEGVPNIPVGGEHIPNIESIRFQYRRR